MTSFISIIIAHKINSTSSCVASHINISKVIESRPILAKHSRNAPTSIGGQILQMPIACEFVSSANRYLNITSILQNELKIRCEKYTNAYHKKNVS